MPGSSDQAKRHAAQAALAEVRSGMVLGLGTGSTAAIFVEELIAKIKADRLELIGIPTSEKTAAQAKAGGIRLATLAEQPRIDITFDGADAIDLGNFCLLKGLGGALLREKIVAEASARLVVIADTGKVPAPFGGIVPVEIVKFGAEATFARLAKVGPATMRQVANSSDLYVTDNGNYIVDLALASIAAPAELENSIKHIAGVVETGLFLTQASRIIIGNETGVEVYDRPVS